MKWKPVCFLLSALFSIYTIALPVYDAGLKAATLSGLNTTIEPGSFTSLEATLPPGFRSFSAFHNHGTRNDPDTWNSRGQWDPIRQRTYFFGERHSSVFHSYRADGNHWSHNALDDMIPTAPHQYGGVALDAKRGHFYRMSGGGLYRYIVDEGYWEVASASAPTQGTGAIEYHEGLDAIIGIAEFKLYRFKNNNWTEIHQSSHEGHHTNMLYNRVRGDMIITGGNKSPGAVSILKDNGSLREKKDAPFHFSARHHSLSYDPQTGNYLLMHRKDYTIWEYNPDQDEWRLAKDWREDPEQAWPFGQYFGHVLIPIDDHGLILWIHRSGPQLYRHKSVFTITAVSRGEGLTGQTPAQPEDGAKAVPDSQPQKLTTPDPGGRQKTGPSILAQEIHQEDDEPTQAPASSASQLSSSTIQSLRKGNQPDAELQTEESSGTELTSSMIRSLRTGDTSLTRMTEFPTNDTKTGTTRQADSPEAQAIATQTLTELEPPIAHRHPPHKAFSEIGKNMEPGEWRYVETTNLPNFRVELCPLGNNRTTHALGWTDAFAYDPQTQTFWALGMRDSSEKRLYFLNNKLEWNEVRVPIDECKTDRRPFNRLTLVDGYLYWPSSNSDDGDRRSRGQLWRAPIRPFLEGKKDIKWEQFSPGLDISNMNSAGDFAVEYYPEMGGWIFYGRRSRTTSASPFSQEGDTPEGLAMGKSWYGQARFFKQGDSTWTFFDRAYSGQYRARLLYNPIKREVLLAPGGEFGSQPPQDAPQREWAKIRHSGGDNKLVNYAGSGPIPWVEKLDRDVGENITYYGPRYSSLTYNPRNGDYLWWNREKEAIWSSADGKNWKIYEEFSNIPGPRFPSGTRRFMGGEGLFGATGYVQMNAIQGTDLVVFIDPDRGVILHRVHDE